MWVIMNSGKISCESSWTAQRVWTINTSDKIDSAVMDRAEMDSAPLLVITRAEIDSAIMDNAEIDC